jgi:hypothetical protein
MAQDFRFPRHGGVLDSLKPAPRLQDAISLSVRNLPAGSGMAGPKKAKTALSGNRGFPAREKIYAGLKLRI